MSNNIIDAIRNTGEHIQEIRNEVGGPEYVAERESALLALREGKPLEAIAHKVQGIRAAGEHYEEESPLSRLRRIRERTKTEATDRSR